MISLIDILLLSAQLPNTVYCINKARSFIKIINSEGLSIDPYGTTATTLFLVPALLLITTPCLPFFR